ncbi:MAG: hypothetical protein JWO03_2786 [Bacteroidetes bacterium]|nr:hypothetical protein [Bacteroidota bacterium]
MKKTLIKLCSVAAIGLALTACNNDAANKVALDADNTAIDNIVQDKIKTLDDSLSKVCDDQVLAAAAKVEADAPKGTGHATAHTTAPKKEESKKAEPKKPETKADKMGGNGGTSSDPKSKASKMGGNDNAPAPDKSKASKMGGNK